jgi:hypothetical protein
MENEEAAAQAFKRALLNPQTVLHALEFIAKVTGEFRPNNDADKRVRIIVHGPLHPGVFREAAARLVA